MRLINLRSIRTKVILISIAILCITISALTIISSYLSAKEYTSILNSNAYVVGQNLKVQLDRLFNLGLNIENIYDFNQYCVAIPVNYPDLAYALVTDSQGEVFFYSHQELIDRILDQSELLQDGNDVPYKVNQYRFQDQLHNEVVIGVPARWGGNGAYIAVGFSHKVLGEKVRPIIVSTSIIALFSFVLSVFLLVFTLSVWITQPLTRLLKVIQEIRQEDLSVKQVKVDSRDEIGQLADTFNKMIQELNYNRKILIEKNRLQRELEIARMIQTSLLPDAKEVSHRSYDIYATMIPATEVGGDYYDILTDKQGRLWLGIGDVTGHGVMSGLIMMMLQTATFTCINANPEITPAALVNLTNIVLYENIRKRLNIQRFMTLAFLRGEASGEFLFSGKHLPVIIFRKSLQECEMVDIKGFWAGVLPDISAKTVTTQFRLHKGDVLFLYSDGITEAINHKRQLYGFENFIMSINKNCRDTARSAREILQGVMNDLFTHMDIQRDDISLVVVKKR